MNIYEKKETDRWECVLLPLGNYCFTENILVYWECIFPSETNLGYLVKNYYY